HHELFPRERRPVLLADLFLRGIGHDEQHNIREIDRLLDGAALAFGPAESTSSFSCSGWREENMTGWPALANSVPREPPSRPAPIVPILSGAPPPWLCASAATGEAASASSAAVLPAKCRKSRRRRSERRGVLMVGISGR